MINSQEFTQAMTLPLRQAMAAVRWLEGRVSHGSKSGQPNEAKAAVSDGDCVSQEILLTALRAHFPGVALDAEEDTPGVKSFAANDSPFTVRVDPIDGSLRYLRGDGLYAIIVGLERENLVEASLIAVPQEDVLIRAVRDGGAEISRDGRPFTPVRASAGGSRVLVSHGVADDVVARLRDEPGVGVVAVAAGGAIGVAPLLEATRGALRVSHDRDGLSRRAWIAGLCAREAGAAVEALEGELPERYERGVPGMIVACDAAGVEALRRLL